MREFLTVETGSAVPAIGPVTAARPTPQNWPAARTPFFGRREELAEIARLLADPACRLLTLLGPGGTGKTRLALEAAHRLLANTPATLSDGVFFVPLAPLNRFDQLVPAIANAVGFSFCADQSPSDQLLDYLRARRLLLVLDNCEHLLDDATACLLVDLLNSAPGLALLATSRTKLNVVGEQVFFVSGLQAPGPEAGEETLPAAALGRYSALQLFQQAARRVRPDFSVTTENLADVVRICRLVDGMPLAIELASAWVEMLPTGEIAAEIERSLDFLESNLRDLPERHRSLRAVFVSSWALLTDEEREALQGLSIFRGNFTRQAAETVSGASLRTLLGLVNKSWLQPVSGRDGRYQIHPLLRQYASARLITETQAWRERRQRHAGYYAGRVQQFDEALRGAQPQDAHNALRADFEEVLAAGSGWFRRSSSNRWCNKCCRRFSATWKANSSPLCSSHFSDMAQQAIKAAGSPPAYRQQLIILLSAEPALLKHRLVGAECPARCRLWRAAGQGGRGLVDGEGTGKPGGPRVVGCFAAAVYAWMVNEEAGLQQLRGVIPLLRQAERPWVLAFALQQVGWVEYQRIENFDQADEHLSEALPSLTSSATSARVP